MTTCHTDMQIENVAILKEISKKYPYLKTRHVRDVEAGRELWALKDISLNINKGEIIGIIGRNGAGKTTLLNIIAKVITPTEGEVSLKGKALGLFNLGVGFQDELTGRENIFLNGAIIGASKRELDRKLDAIIAFSELGDFINMPLGTYSQGMRLRLGFSIVVNLECDILIIDEVLAVGDSLFQSKCFKRLMDFKRQGKTLIISSQNMDLIERLCDRAVLLEHGHLLFFGEVREAINRYCELLNTQRFFVGPPKEEMGLVEDTKKWANETYDWGKKLGAKEVEIESVEFINRFGLRRNKIKSNEPLKIRVNFNAKNNIKEPHFGIAIFRNDGVYCYGPNTTFDGYDLSAIKSGKGCFILNYKGLLLASGEYRVSIAIWDKNETLAYDYHNGYYELIIKGEDSNAGELLRIPYRIESKDSTQKLISGLRKDSCLIDLAAIKDKWGKKIDANGIKVESIKLLDSNHLEKTTFMTNEPVFLNVKFSELNSNNKSLILWLGIFRDDRVYCQGINVKLGKNKNVILSFPKFPLLPGGYSISIGVWDFLQRKFLTLHHGTYSFRMVFTRRDHGTVYLEHTWQWRMSTL